MYVCDAISYRSLKSSLKIFRKSAPCIYLLKILHYSFLVFQKLAIAMPKNATLGFSADQRLDLFSRVVEPALQRELKYKGVVNGDGSYSAELIGYVEIIDQGA